MPFVERAVDWPVAHVRRLHEFFLAAADRHPERIALERPPGVAGETRVRKTYRELRERAAGIAARLRPLAVPDAVVVVVLPRDAPDLYAAQLGILMAGAAFACADVNFPDANLAEIARGAAAVLSDQAGTARLAAAGISAIDVAGIMDAGPSAVTPRAPPRHAPNELTMPAAIEPGNLAYVIYTSGTTGKPKGVEIEHRSIVNLIASNFDYFPLGPDDRVAQCSSPAYDSSIEETWLALAFGGTLVLLGDETIRLGPDLVPWLRRERITVFCPPPTLLRGLACAEPARELPEIKLLYVGGEALPADIAERWAGATWMENGYGPTEAAVTALRCRVRAHEPVRIGFPIANTAAYILDDQLQVVADGETGELCLAGVHLARGYRGLPALTAEKFPEHPILGRIYRTGDLARQEADGVVCLGRIDRQVKLRGYRIELEAIEAQLAACAGVRGAACKLQTEGPGQILVALVVPNREAPDVEALRRHVRAQLPPYMVPARIGTIAALPTTAGGKLDRARLPDVAAVAAAVRPPRTPAEREVRDAFGAALHRPSDIPLDANFFLDLGGDSVTAVAAVVHLRRAGWNPSARDLYDAPTVTGLAETLQHVGAGARAAAGPAAKREGRPVFITTLQGLWIALECALGGLVLWYAAFRLFDHLTVALGDAGAGAVFIGLLAAAFLLSLPISVAATVLLKHLLIGRYRPQRIPAWSGDYFRHWIVTNAARRIPWWFFQGTIVTGLVLRCLGARVGRRLVVHRGVDLTHGGWDLLDIGDDVTLSQECALRLADLDQGHVVIGPISLGDGATLAVRAGMDPGTAIEPNGYLGPLAWLPAGTILPANQRWDGVPASRTGPAPTPPAVAPAPSPARHATVVIAARTAALLITWLPWLVGGAFVVGAFDQNLFHARDFIIAGIATAVAIMAKLIAQAITARILTPAEPISVSIFSPTAIRIDTVTGIVDEASRWLAGTLLWPVWLRLAGMRLGRSCEISTIIDVVPSAISIGHESFFADGIYLASPVRHRGTLTLQPTILGRNTFLGNHAVVLPGHRYPDGLFAGVATIAPIDAPPDSAWFGQPPMPLPRREVVLADRSLTHRPSLVRRLTRIFWEAARFALPIWPLYLAGLWALWLEDISLARALWLVPAVTLGLTAALPLAIIPAKWILLGRTRPGQRAFWSCWCGRWDFLYVAWEFWGRTTLALLDGSLLLNAFLRLTGARIGRRVLLGPNLGQLVDPDMLVIGDDATVACHLQTHSFEDRTLKMDIAHIGAGATMGDGAIILYGIQVEAGAELAPHSVLMKFDRIPAAEIFQGAPAGVRALSAWR